MKPIYLRPFIGAHNSIYSSRGSSGHRNSRPYHDPPSTTIEFATARVVTPRIRAHRCRVEGAIGAFDGADDPVAKKFHDGPFAPKKKGRILGCPWNLVTTMGTTTYIFRGYNPHFFLLKKPSNVSWVLGQFWGPKV